MRNLPSNALSMARKTVVKSSVDSGRLAASDADMALRIRPSSEMEGRMRGSCLDIWLQFGLRAKLAGKSGTSNGAIR